MDRRVDWYFAPQSPWTFLGHARFLAMVERHELAVGIKAADFGRVFAASGGLQLAQRPKQRQSYRLEELERFARQLDIPLKLQPRVFPVDGKEASLRILAAEATEGQAAALRFAGAVMRAVWVDDGDIADGATLDAIARAGGLDAPALRDASRDPSVERRYQANTDEAIACDVFGAPTWIPRFGPCEGRRFWGQDRLDFLERAVES